MPTCKYGHGSLERQANAWSIAEAVPAQQPSPGSNYNLTGVGFVLSMYRCPACGYIELFDDDEVA